MNTNKIKTSAKHTPGLFNAVRVSRSSLYKGRPYKKLTKRLGCRTGLNHSGRRVSRRTNGVKRFYRIIDLTRNDFDQKYKILRIEYDPNRSCFIALVMNTINQSKKYFIAPKNAKEGDIIHNLKPTITSSFFNTGDRTYIKNFDVGDYVYNIELLSGQGGKIARSAGEYAIIIKKHEHHVEIQLPSKKKRLIHNNCSASFGHVGNALHRIERYGKASYYRYIGWKPRVSGIAKNPCDHPMGGHGSTAGRPYVSKTGLLSVGGRTRKKHKYSDKFVFINKKNKKKHYKLNKKK